MLFRSVVASVNPLDPDRPVVRLPAGRGTEEVQVDMTDAPVVLAPQPAARATAARP